MAQVSTNDKFIENRTRIGRYASLLGLGVIAVGFFASLQNEVLPAYGALIVGFILSNVGAYYLNRWGLRAHERLSAALKGLEKRYRLYNFLLPVPHVLLGPSGVTVFLVKNQEGAIQGDEKGWRQGSSILRLFRALSTEPLGNPPRELDAQKQKLRTFISANLAGAEQVPIDGYVVFTNPRAQVKLQNVEVPVIVLNESPDALKNALRREKRSQLPRTTYDQLVTLFEKEAEAQAAEPQNLLSLWRR